MFPATEPESGPEELARSLSDLIRDTAVASECLRGPLRKPADDLARRVRLLNPLFDELRDREGSIGRDALAGLISIRSAIAAANDLLRHVNDGSKLFQALEWEKHSSRFYQVTCLLEEALSKVPYHQLDLTVEAREQIKLVHDQIKRAKGRRDLLDRELSVDLSSAMKDGDTNQAILSRLSEKLQINTTSDVKKEFQTLHEMVIKEEKEPEHLRQIANVLSKLAGFTLSSSDASNGERSSWNNTRAPVIPDEFRCPICLELMRDPVIVATGQTYDRACIEKWLADGHKTCPKTQVPLPHTLLTPNFALRSLIVQWCETNGIKLPERAANLKAGRLGGCVFECSRADIAHLLNRLSSGKPEDQRAAAGELRLLAKRNADNRILIAEAGAIPLLVQLLSSSDARTQEHAVTALLNLSINENNKGTIVAEGALLHIVGVLKNGNMEARENAATTLFSLSVVDDYKVEIGAAGAIPALMDLLSQGSQRGKKDAATALFNLSIASANKVIAVKSGIVKHLMALLKDVSSGMMDEALTIMALLVGSPDGKSAIGQEEPIPVLVDVLKTGSPRNRENAVAVLLGLCTSSAQNLTVARQEGAEEALKEVIGSGTSTARAKRKAVSLLEHMNKSEVDPPPA